MKLLKSAVFVSVVLLAAFNIAQQRSTLRGTVTGPDGEVIPGVVVKITSPDQNISVQTVTNDRGMYVLRDLPPGVYRVELMLQGSSLKVFEGVEVKSNARNELDVGFATQGHLVDYVSPLLVLEAAYEGMPQGKIVQEIPLTLDTAIESLPQGKMVHNIPKVMTQGVTERIEVRISKNLKAELLLNLLGRGIPVLQTLTVSTVMKVKLQGNLDFFRIDSLSLEEQVVAETDYTEWEWDVTPLISGKGSLRLRAIVVLGVEGAGEKNKEVDSHDETVTVEINVPWIVATFFGDYWQWIIGTIIALIGVILAYLKLVYPILSKKRNNADAADN